MRVSMTERVMMKCGCAAQGVMTARGGVKFDPPIPSCVIHDCIEIAETPNLTGRIAKCAYKGCKTNSRRSTHYGAYTEDGRSEAPSSLDLPFFEHRPTEPFDRFYCGCNGWD